jgi:hypothetical protein
MRTLPTITAAQLLGFGPCAEYLKGGKRESVISQSPEWDARGLLSLDIPDDHKLWAVLRLELLPQDLLDNCVKAIHADYPELRGEIVPPAGSTYEQDRDVILSSLKKKKYLSACVHCTQLARLIPRNRNVRQELARQVEVIKQQVQNWIDD